jgi:hypothetical protein
VRTLRFRQLSIAHSKDDEFAAVTKLSHSNARETLFSAYLAQVNGIRDGEKKDRLLKWADIDNDASLEISTLLRNQNLDVTTDGSRETRILVLDEEARAELAFNRERLLALTTSCDGKTLKDVGDLLRYTRVSVPCLRFGICTDLDNAKVWKPS